MSDLIDRQETTIARRQVLVLRCNAWQTSEDMNKLRQQVLEQIKSGVVVVDSTVEVFSIDNDGVIVLGKI